MIEITYEEFDELIDAIDKKKVPKSYKYPSLEEAENCLVDMNGLKKVLFAAEKTPDKEYSKELNKLLRLHIVYIESKISDINELVSLTQKERLLKISEKMKNLDYRCPDFCPSKIELDEIASKNLKKDDAAVGYLLWVSGLEEESDSPDIIDSARYAKKLLKDKLG